MAGALLGSAYFTLANEFGRTILALRIDRQDSASKGVWGSSPAGHGLHGESSLGWAGYFDGRLFAARIQDGRFSPPATVRKVGAPLRMAKPSSTKLVRTDISRE